MSKCLKLQWHMPCIAMPSLRRGIDEKDTVSLAAVPWQSGSWAFETFQLQPLAFLLPGAFHDHRHDIGFWSLFSGRSWPLRWNPVDFFHLFGKHFHVASATRPKNVKKSKLETSCSKTTWLGVDVESLMTHVVWFEVYLLLQALFVIECRKYKRCFVSCIIYHQACYKKPRSHPGTWTTNVRWFLPMSSQWVATRWSLESVGRTISSSDPMSWMWAAWFRVFLELSSSQISRVSSATNPWASLARVFYAFSLGLSIRQRLLKMIELFFGVFYRHVGFQSFRHGSSFKLPESCRGLLLWLPDVQGDGSLHAGPLLVEHYNPWSLKESEQPEKHAERWSVAIYSHHHFLVP